MILVWTAHLPLDYLVRSKVTPKPNEQTDTIRKIIRRKSSEMSPTEVSQARNQRRNIIATACNRRATCATGAPK